MHRITAGLIVSLVFCAALFHDDAQGGHKKSKRSCCAPDTCCRPQPSVCCPTGNACFDAKVTTTYFCVASSIPLIDYGDGTGSYRGTAYSSNGKCGAGNPGNTCSQPLSNAAVANANPPVPQRCPRPPTYTLDTPGACCLPAARCCVDACGNVQCVTPTVPGLREKIHFDPKVDQSKAFKLHDSATIVGWTFAKFQGQRTPSGPVDETFYLWLLVIKFIDPDTPDVPVFYGIGLEIVAFPTGVDSQAPWVAANGTGYVRNIHFGIDYTVRLASH